MKNARAKGRRSEKKAEAILKSQGWEVELVRGSQKFNKSVDFFGRFDLICLHPQTTNPIKNLGGYEIVTFEQKEKIKFVQVKTNKCAKSIREDLKLFKQKYPSFEVEIWIFKDRVKGPEVLVIGCLDNHIPTFRAGTVTAMITK